MKRVLATLALATLAATAGAQDAGSGPNPYRDCGIGAALFPNTNWAAVTSNVIWDIGTTAVTSATVSPETCQDPKRVAMADFIKGSYASLEADLIRGDGQWVEGLTSVSGCSNEQATEFVSNVRTGLRDAYRADGFARKTNFEKGATVYAVAESAAAMCGV